MRNKKRSEISRVLLTVVLAVCVLSPAVPSAHAWEKRFGDGVSDYGFFGQQTTDGGYIVTGDTYDIYSNSSDVYLVKTSSSGAILWQRAFGGIDQDEGNSVRQTKDGGFIIAGSTASFGAGATDVYLIKTNANGSRLWQRTFGGKGDDWANSVQQTKDGGYILVGGTNSYGAGQSDVYLVKTDANGNRLWQKTCGGTGWDYGNHVQQTQEGGYIVVGETASYGTGSYDVYLIKMDAKGNKLWQKVYGGGYADYGRFVQQTRDGGYFIVGYTDDYYTKACWEER